jgi:hypothetical protein
MQQLSFRKFNLITGWCVFLISATVYLLTIEPTASFWDCGEYIACSYGLETGHPPGAPFFLLMGRFFSFFAFGNEKLVAACINGMSAVASAFTVLFLFWSITHFAKKVLAKGQEQIEKSRLIVILAAGAVGALSYSFTDTAWFSAVEGEVYALSSFFTAIVFWAMLKWENVADEPHADRWLIFITYMIGLSIGVHLLNLLTIPALVFMWYFRKKKVTGFGLAGVTIVAALFLGGVQNMIIPGIVNLAGKSEIYFVNELEFGFNSGIIFYFSLLVALIAGGLFFSYRKRIVWLNTALLCFTVLLIGYSSFFILVIRAQAGTPINEGNVSNPVSLLSYLNREQYGDWPLLYGQNYNTPLDPLMPYLDGKPVYVRDDKSGRYIVSDDRKGAIYNYDERGCTFFPRMYSAGHKGIYESWPGVDKDTVIFTDPNGRITAVENIPTFRGNMRFFLTYQCGQMYLRYLGWNFLGRQNDLASLGNNAEGNVLTGAPLIDDIFAGDQDLLPEMQRNNKARNRYFFIPAILVLFGLAWHYMTAKRDAFIVTLLFLFTGLAIVLYLNQTPGQPRERDYAYVGSFYAISIWLGLGVIGLWETLKGLLQPLRAVSIATALSVGSPLILVAQNWDDHDRSGRTVAEDVAINFLESCEKNAVLFTYADNDTFPLWYAQEVLGVRRDVRIICLSLLNSDWYIDQAKRKQHTADPLPISMEHWDYREGTRDYLFFRDSNDTLSLDTVVDRFFDNYIATRNVSLPVNKTEFLKTSTLPDEREDEIGDTIVWRLRGSYLMKDQLIVLDFLAHNDWKRPVYFAANMPLNCYAGLDDYLQLEGLAYRMVPVANDREEKSFQLRPAVQLDKSYRMIMSSFRYGGLSDPGVYADETVQRMFSDPMRIACSQTAMALAEAGERKKAVDVIRKCIEGIPANQVAPDGYWLDMVEAAYVADDIPLATSLSRTMFEHNIATLRWYRSMTQTTWDFGYKRDANYSLIDMADIFENTSLSKEFRKKMKDMNLEMPERVEEIPSE